MRGDWVKSDLYEMIYKLADRGFNKALAGEGSQESRAVALLLSAIDQLATAATLDPSISQSVKEAIEIIRMRVEEQSGKKKSPDESKDWMKEGGDKWQVDQKSHMKSSKQESSSSSSDGQTSESTTGDKE
jgi:hypothetical protein